MDANTDKLIIAMLRKPETKRQAFNMLVKEMSQALYWQIRKLVLSHDSANDVLQNTFLKTWEHLDQFKGDAKISTWMHRIAINESYALLQKERMAAMSDFEDLEDICLQRLQSDPYFDGDEVEMKLQAAVLSLPEKQRLVFNMKYYQEMKYEDISEILGTTVGALKASYHHAVKKIEAYMTAELYG